MLARPRSARRAPIGRYVELDAAPGRAPLEHGDVAAVGVDVQVVGIEVADDDLRRLLTPALASQYGRTSPRSAAIARSASIAVYVGSTASSPPGGVSSSPRSSARSRSGTTSIRSGVEAAVLEAQRQLLRALAGRDESLERAEQRLEVDVPDPGDVAAVGDRRRSARRRRARGGPPSTSVRTTSFAPAGFLTSSRSTVRSPDRDPLEAAERGAEAAEARARSRRAARRGRARATRRRARCRRCRGPGARARHAAFPGGVDEVERGAVEPVELDRRARRRRAAAARGRTPGQR